MQKDYHKLKASMGSITSIQLGICNETLCKNNNSFFFKNSGFLQSMMSFTLTGHGQSCVSRIDTGGKVWAIASLACPPGATAVKRLPNSATDAIQVAASPLTIPMLAVPHHLWWQQAASRTQSAAPFRVWPLLPSSSSASHPFPATAHRWEALIHQPDFISTAPLWRVDLHSADPALDMGCITGGEYKHPLFSSVRAKDLSNCPKAWLLYLLSLFLGLGHESQFWERALLLITLEM